MSEFTNQVVKKIRMNIFLSLKYSDAPNLKWFTHTKIKQKVQKRTNGTTANNFIISFLSQSSKNHASLASKPDND